MYNLHLTHKEFQDNYNTDLEAYLKSFNNLTESDFKAFLIEKYNEQIEAIDFMANQQIKGHFKLVSTLKRLRQNKLKASEHSDKLYNLCFGENDEFNEVIHSKLKTEIKSVLKTLGNKPSVKPSDKLSLKEIALLFIHEGKVITRENAKEIAEAHDWKSGDALYNNYTAFIKRSERTAKPHPFTQRTLKNKIELFEKVLTLVQYQYSQAVKDELIILNNYKNEL